MTRVWYDWGMGSGDRPWRLLSRDLFTFATTDLRELHTAVLAAFDDAAVLQPALRLEQVRALLADSGWDEALDDDRLRQTLAQLVEWQLLDVTQDHAATYATPEEFERRNLQWSLTPNGEAAIGGVLFALSQLRRAVSLQPAVLDAIADGLADLARLFAGDGGAGPDAVDAARVATTLSTVESHHESMVASVRQFNRHLQRLLKDDGADDEVFLDVKRRTVEYLQEYVDGIDLRARRVAAAIERLTLPPGPGVAVLHDAAVRGANLAPVAGEDPAPGWLAQRAKRWDALHAWFLSDAQTGEEARVSTLADIARSAVIQLLRVLERRWEARRRSASVADDFRALARWFAAAESEADAHRLFNAAFGLWSARHAHLRSDDDEATSPSTSFTEATPVEVAPSLRTSGSLTNRGKVRPVADPAAIRARRQLAQAEALQRHERLRAALATNGVVPLSAFRRLDADAFAELLLLLANALSAGRSSDGIRRALSADGRVEVVLHPPSSPHATTRLLTEGGTLTAPDFGVSISVIRGMAVESDSRAVAGG